MNLATDEHGLKRTRSFSSNACHPEAGEARRGTSLMQIAVRRQKSTAGYEVDAFRLRKPVTAFGLGHASTSDRHIRVSSVLIRGLKIVLL